MTATETLPVGQCVCGRRIPERSPSDWACSEVCQAAWQHHQADPQYPHPRDIRAAVQARLAGVRLDAAHDRETAAGLPAVAEGTEIDVDGQPYVRVGAHWQPAGQWTPAHGYTSCTYDRWCPACRRRVASLIYPADDQQECAECGHRWAGRPLLGAIELRGEPWPALRLRLSDGQRSVSTMFSLEETRQVFGDEQLMSERVAWCWLRMERQLGGGYADQDEPGERQRRRQQRRLNRVWHLHVDAQ